MNASPSKSWKRFCFFWAAMLIVVAIPVATKVHQNVGYSSFPAIQEKAASASAKASTAFYNKLHYILRAQMTRREVEAATNGGKVIPTHDFWATSADGGPPELLEVGFLTDPSSGGKVHISFTQDGSSWRDYGPVMPTTSFGPPDTPGWVLGEEIRDRIARFAPLVWCLVLLGWPLVRRRINPGVMAQILVATGLLWLAAQWLNPFYTTRTSPFEWACPALAATGVGIIAWMPAIIVSRLGRSRDLGFCVQCSYNLTGNLSGVCPECGTLIGLP